MRFESQASKLVFIGHQLTLPPSVARQVVHFQLSLPDDKALEAMIAEEARGWAKEFGR